MHMRQLTRQSLVQVLFGTKPLSKPMLSYCELIMLMGAIVNENWIKIQKFFWQENELE